MINKFLYFNYISVLTQSSNLGKLGFFAGTKWDGKYTANGSIVVKKDLQLLGFHVIQIENLKSYLFENIRFDTPSSTRHRFGSLYLEKNNKLYFKLNLQLRFT